MFNQTQVDSAGHDVHDYTTFEELLYSAVETILKISSKYSDSNSACLGSVTSVMMELPQNKVKTKAHVM